MSLAVILCFVPANFLFDDSFNEVAIVLSLVVLSFLCVFFV